MAFLSRAACSLYVDMLVCGKLFGMVFAHVSHGEKIHPMDLMR